MSVFTEQELEYIASQKLGRLATVGKDGNPHVVPVGFFYNADLDTIDIVGRAMGQSKKWRDAGQHPRVAFVIDDVLPPWKPRMLEIRADAELVESGGNEMVDYASAEIMRLRIRQINSYSINPETWSTRKIEG